MSMLGKVIVGLVMVTLMIVVIVRYVYFGIYAIKS